MLLVFVAVVGCVTAALIVWPRSYRSESKLYVRLGRENMAIDPTATLGQPAIVTLNSTREDELNSLVEMFHSRVVAEKVVDAIGPDVILERSPLGAAEADNAADQPSESGGAVQAESPTITDRDRAIVKLANSINVEAAKKSDIITVTYDSHSPRLSQAVVSKLVDSYLEEHIRLNRTPGARDFLTRETEDLRKDLARREEALRDLKNKIGLASPEAHRQVITTRVGRLQDELLQVESEIAATTAEVQAVKSKQSGFPTTDVTARTEGIANSAADGMQQQLYALRVREQELLSNRTPDHPEVKLIHEQVEAATKLAEQQEPSRVQVTTGPNRPYEEAQSFLIHEEPVLASLRSKADVLRQQLSQSQSELREYNNYEVRLADLQREIDLRTASYGRYSESLRQAGIDQAMEVQKISNINIVQPATYDPRPVRPRVFTSLLLALVLGGLSTILVALAAETYDHSFRTAEDIEHQLQMPVLATLPRMEPVAYGGNGRR
jgi:uncharacterized protein involved in exopolysaccharide biosynthesis